MDKKVFYKLMWNLNLHELKELMSNTKVLHSYLPREISDQMGLRRLHLFLNKIVKKKENKGGDKSAINK